MKRAYLGELATTLRFAMTDARNIAHDKKVQQEKKRQGEDIAPGADETSQPARKPHQEHNAKYDATPPTTPTITTTQDL